MGRCHEFLNQSYPLWRRTKPQRRRMWRHRNPNSLSFYICKNRNRLAELENAKYGLAFASGLAAETTLVLSLLKNGDHVIVFEDLYGGTRRLFDRTLANFGLEFSYVDATRTENIESAI